MGCLNVRFNGDKDAVSTKNIKSSRGLKRRNIKRLIRVTFAAMLLNALYKSIADGIWYPNSLKLELVNGRITILLKNWVHTHTICKGLKQREC